jgi:isochorismate synthase
MMDKAKEAILNIDHKELVPKLINKEFPFAYWKMPNEGAKYLIVGLSKAVQISTILDLDSGFLVNRFDNNHPKTPYHIKADILFKKDQKPAIDPRINDSQLTHFIKAVEAEKTSEPHSELTETRTNTFEELVEDAITNIKQGQFDKVVLSRFKDIEIPVDFSIGAFFDKICQTYSNAFCSLIYLPGDGIWVGASPELLISDNHQQFMTAALAGTKKLEQDQLLSEISWTQKEIEEQAFVSRYVINCFKKIRLREFEEYGPKTIKAGNLTHLKTEFKVDYNEVRFEGLADQMLDLLHPTSAVCGMPLEPAMNFIHENEQHDRSFYSGFLGPVNFNNSTDLFVNLRCMNIKANQARLFAGAGITEDSNPEKEKLETELKMQTLLSLFEK